MIPAPNRLAAPTRSSAASGTPAGHGPGAPDVGETDSAGPLDARITRVVTRASTPEDEALEKQRQEFDYIARVQAETEREINALRDMAMEQVKHDEELLKKWIALI